MDYKNYLKKLPDQEKTFKFELKGNISQITFDGDFTCKVLKIKDQIEVAKYKAFLNGGFELGMDPASLDMNDKIAFLKVSLVKFPTWWEDCSFGQDLFDENITKELYAKVVEFDNEWVAAINGTSK